MKSTTSNDNKKIINKNSQQKITSNKKERTITSIQIFGITTNNTE